MIDIRSVLILLCTYWIFSVSSVVRFVVLSDLRVDTSSDYIDELLPTLTDLNFDYILISGHFNNNFNDTDNLTDDGRNLNGTINIIKQLSALNKKIFWVPGDQDGPLAFELRNATNIDVNVHNTSSMIVPGLYVYGFGGSVSSYQGTDLKIKGLFSENDIKNGLTFLFSKPNSNNSIILLTHCGPANFSTSLVKTLNPLTIDTSGVLPLEQWYDTGSQSITDFLAQNTANIILNTHGRNPSGIGESNYGITRIINSGSTRYTKSFVLVEISKSSYSKWIVNSWKFYRYGSLMSDFKTTVNDVCLTQVKKVAMPYIKDLYSKISVGLYLGLSGVIVILILSYLSSYGLLCHSTPAMEV